MAQSFHIYLWTLTQSLLGCLCAKTKTKSKMKFFAFLLALEHALKPLSNLRLVYVKTWFYLFATFHGSRQIDIICEGFTTWCLEERVLVQSGDPLGVVEAKNHY